jgi:hypothetical protein
MSEIEDIGICPACREWSGLDDNGASECCGESMANSDPDTDTDR